MLLIKDRFQGVFLCFVLALPAYFLGKEFEIIGGPVFAILIGMLLSKFVREKDILKSGITFTSKICINPRSQESPRNQQH